jgi:hypothetical protein
MLKTPGDREMVEILALVLQHDEQAVLAAVELALEAGAPTKTHILNLLHRLVDGKPTDAPLCRPEADCSADASSRDRGRNFMAERPNALWVAGPCHTN